MFPSYKQLLALIFPPSNDERLVVAADPARFSVQRVQHFSNVQVLLPYHDPVVTAAVHLAKFHHHPHALKLLAASLLGGLQAIGITNPLIVPMPLSASRLHERGYNQVVEVVAAIPRHQRPEYSTRVLYKHRDTIAQRRLNRVERLANVHGVYACTRSAVDVVRGRHMILLDDVVTTGATMAAARAALAPLPYASLTCLALAH